MICVRSWCSNKLNQFNDIIPYLFPIWCIVKELISSMPRVSVNWATSTPMERTKPSCTLPLVIALCFSTSQSTVIWYLCTRTFSTRSSETTLFRSSASRRKGSWNRGLVFPISLDLHTISIKLTDFELGCPVSSIRVLLFFSAWCKCPRWSQSNSSSILPLFRGFLRPWKEGVTPNLKSAIASQACRKISSETKNVRGIGYHCVF